MKSIFVPSGTKFFNFGVENPQNWHKNASKSPKIAIFGGVANSSQKIATLRWRPATPFVPPTRFKSSQFGGIPPRLATLLEAQLGELISKSPLPNFFYTVFWFFSGSVLFWWIKFWFGAHCYKLRLITKWMIFSSKIGPNITRQVQFLSKITFSLTITVFIIKFVTIKCLIQF